MYGELREQVLDVANYSRIAFASNFANPTCRPQVEFALLNRELKALWSNFWLLLK